MKLPSVSRREQSGNVLLVCIIMSAIMGVSLASYLMLSASEYRSVIRSQTWNYSLALTEAGLEDGLAAINKRNGDFATLSFWTNSVDSDNWSSLGNGVYYTKRVVSVDGWGTNYYEVYITNAYSGPTLSAVGVASWKSTAAPIQTVFAAVGVDAPSVLRQATRRVKVTTKMDSLFAVAMAAVQVIDLNGNNIMTDSFDSSDPNHSINGLYPFANQSMVNSNGDVCTTATIQNSISVGNANIKGKAKTGPLGTVAVGPNGYVTGGIADDFNVKFPEVTLPIASWLPTPSVSVNINGVNYNNAIFSSGDYTLPGYSSRLYIGSNVTCRIYITANVNLTGNDEIHLAKTAKVTLYMRGASFSIAGNGIINENGNADSFSYYGLPSNTSVSFGGNGGFTGVIYAPQAAFTLGGGGNDIKDFIGSSVTKSVTMNGHFRFHYDENLRKVGPGRGYIPIGWTEVGN